MKLRELLWMCEGRAEQAWAHTSYLVAMNFNAHRTSKRDKIVKPEQVNPLRQSTKTVEPGGMEALKAHWTGKGSG